MGAYSLPRSGEFAKPKGLKGPTVDDINPALPMIRDIP